MHKELPHWGSRSLPLDNTVVGGHVICKPQRMQVSHPSVWLTLKTEMGKQSRRQTILPGEASHIVKQSPLPPARLWSTEARSLAQTATPRPCWLREGGTPALCTEKKAEATQWRGSTPSFFVGGGVRLTDWRTATCAWPQSEHPGPGLMSRGCGQRWPGGNASERPCTLWPGLKPATCAKSRMERPGHVPASLCEAAFLFHQEREDPVYKIGK